MLHSPLDPVQVGIFYHYNTRGNFWQDWHEYNVWFTHFGKVDIVNANVWLIHCCIFIKNGCLQNNCGEVKPWPYSDLYTSALSCQNQTLAIFDLCDLLKPQSISTKSRNIEDYKVNGTLYQEKINGQNILFNYSWISFFNYFPGSSPSDFVIYIYIFYGFGVEILLLLDHIRVYLHFSFQFWLIFL